MNPTTLLVIQAVLSGLQVVNVSLATMQDVPGWVSLVVAAVVAALQSVVQHVGNQAAPVPKQ
jgi:hypothetical protein